MSEAELSAELAALRDQASQLERERSELDRTLASRREEVATLEAELDDLTRRHEALRPGSALRILLYTLLVGVVPGVCWLLYHTEVVLHTVTPVPRVELKRALSLAGLPTRFDVARQGEITRISFSSTLERGERRELWTLLERLVKLEPPTQRPTFWLETTRQDRDKPIRSELQLALDQGDCSFILLKDTRGTRSEQLLVYSVPLATELPREQFIERDPYYRLKSWINRLEDPRGGGLLLDRRIQATPAAYMPLAEELKLQAIKGSVLEEVDPETKLHLVKVFWRKHEHAAGSVLDDEECRQRLIDVEGSLMMGGLVFPVLSRGLKGFEFENTLF